MLHELLAAYLERVERTIQKRRYVYVEHYGEEVLTPERINLRLRLRFEQGHMLEISEAVVIEDDRLVPSTTVTTARTQRIAWSFATIARRTFPIWRTFPTTSTCPTE